MRFGGAEYYYEIFSKASGSDAVDVAGEHGRVAHVLEAEQVHRDALKPEAQTAVRGHAVFVRHEIPLEIVRIHAARAHLGDLFVVVVDALTTRRDLDAAEQKVEAERVFRIFRIVHRIERTLFGRIMGDEQEIAAELLLCPLAEDLLLFGLEVAIVRDLLLVFFGDDLLCVHELDERDLFDHGEIDVEKRKLFRILRFEQFHDVLEGARLHVHDVVEAVDEPHFKVHAHIFVEVTGGVVMLGAEHGPDLEHALIHGHEHLLVKLRALREEHLFAEIVQLEDVCATFRALRVDLGRADLRKVLRKEKIAESAGDPLLDLEHCALLGIAKRHGSEIEIEIERNVVQLFFVDDNGHLLGGRGEHFDVVDLHLVAVLARLILDDLARQLDSTALYHLFVHPIIGKIGRIDALHDLARGADDDKGKARHLADAMDHALHGHFFVDMCGKFFVAHAVVTDHAVYLLHKTNLFELFTFLF